MDEKNPKNKFDVHEYEIYDADGLETFGPTSKNKQLDVNRPRYIADPKPEKKRNYGWAFFLASMFVGLGLSFTAPFWHHGPPVPLFIGIGIGFLFFVKPIHDKIISFFD